MPNHTINPGVRPRTDALHGTSKDAARIVRRCHTAARSNRVPAAFRPLRRVGPFHPGGILVRHGDRALELTFRSLASEPGGSEAARLATAMSKFLAPAPAKFLGLPLG
ncbi:hypothetical protein ACFXB3_05795 [Streptomyces sp. NPDC059447]|uniref:hypothetical protein n=1 Tax=Streptomyces sp. NPDC059447 TaxID=3346834 RepID=UPI00368E843E